MSIRYGIIGTGMMGCEHIRNLAAMDEVDIVAVADPNEEPRDWALKSCGDRFSPRIHEDYRDLLDDDGVDALVVASPNYTHIDVMRDVFKTDKHVMLEKPMCTTLADALELDRLTASHKGIVWIGLEYRYMPTTSALLHHLPAIGEVKMCAIQEHRFPFLKKVGDWNRFNRNTGGTLVEKCCHFFDLMNLVVPGKPVRALASGAQSVNHLDEIYNGEVPDIIDNAYVIVEYDSGARAMLDLCMFAEGSKYEQMISVTGDAGKLETTVPGNELFISKRERDSGHAVPIIMDSRVKHEGFHHGSSFLEHREFIEAIREGSGPAVTTKDGLMSVLVGLAAQQSIETGQAVNIDSLLEQHSDK
ncbi:MAG: Gfo/Idh/MocA family oxidoreductase [Gammaproteobacteria bacterium]|nr:Gfo/Idh/MocA family oxidoreductase [Gammaproteobacteria bacterium]